MKALWRISLLTLALASPGLAHAGPSDGGGTNIVIQENELADFAKFRESYGAKQYLINAKKFKQHKGAAPVYDDVKPIVERLNTLYPGMGSVIDKAFAKPWLVVEAEFTSRKGGERKVISQSDEGIFVNLAWLKKASPEQLRKAYVHEGVRSLARELIKEYGGKPDPKLEDEITEELTPVIYSGLPSNMLASHFKVVGQKIANAYFRWFSTLSFPSREEIYARLKDVKAEKTLRDFCEFVRNTPRANESGKGRNAARNAVALTGEPRDKLYMLSFNAGEGIAKVFDRSAEDAIAMARYVFFSPIDTRINSWAKQKCGAESYETFLKEYEAASGKVVDPIQGSDELPDETNTPSEGSAN